MIAHQITREQWGVDSYTLYGGPPHYPYPASKNWSFIPDFSEKDPVLIVRQTVADPLYNYGEIVKHFTSQPNDYLGSGLDFEYFKKLLNQALFEQKTTGFALLGLENSNDDKYQQEFLKQIEYANQLKDQVVFPDIKQLSNYWSKQKTTSYFGKDLINNTNNRAEFITSPDSRIRVRTKKGKTFTTDYRIYDRNLIDPYNNYAAKKNGYWIAPYSLDYSHIYKSDSVFPETRNDIKIVGKFDEKLIKFDSVKNYPYYLPEPIEREIDRKKSKVKVTIKNDIEVDLFAKDEYGYPTNISYPVELKTDPVIMDIPHQIDSDKHYFVIPNRKENFLTITLSSNKKIIKKIYLFPKLLPFIKASL